MSLEKVTYTDEVTVIGAKNLNDIQDAIIENEQNLEENVDRIDSEMRNQKTRFENALQDVADDARRETQELADSVDTDLLGYGVNLDFDSDTNLLYLTNSENERISDGIAIATGGGGGGGGGGGNNAILTVNNTTGWLSKTISVGADCTLLFNWTSLENDIPTGDGTLTVRVNNAVKRVIGIQQGNVSINVGSLVTAGTNKVRLTVADIYENTRSMTFTIKAEEIYLTSTFDTSSTFSTTERVSFTYTPYGALTKTVYFDLDGSRVGQDVVTSSGRQQSFLLPLMQHGSHSLKVYFTAEINGEMVESNALWFDLIVVNPSSDVPIISSTFRTSTAHQYETISIPYKVYTPGVMTSAISLYDGETKIADLTVDRSSQTWNYRLDRYGTVTLSITAGTVVKSFVLTVEETDIDVEAETEALSLYLTARGRSNNSENRSEWEYEDISATLSNFNWRLDGWQTDGDGITVLRLNDDARVTIPYKLFGTDYKAKGKTIEIEFATREVSDYTATILSCFSGNVGLKITPQNVLIRGAQTEIGTLYKDNEHIRLSITVDKQNENRLILIYINGIMSRAVQYASGERFSQLEPVDITIGSNDCGIDIYNIRVYDNNLTREQILNNWIADTQIGSLMLDRYTRNRVYDDYGNVTIAHLPPDLPYMIIEAEVLPQYKGDKKTVSGSYTDPVNPEKSFTFTGCQANVQGTSSAPYFRKNYDMQFKEGFNIGGANFERYGLRENSIPFNRFVLKADVASSESANNTVLTMFYSDSCPYKTPEQVENPKVRQGIEGVPIVLFWYNTANQTTQFMGKYNFNLPKRAPEPYGFSGNMESWEWERNNSANVKFQDNDFTSQSWDELKQEYYPTWYDDFEARFPSDEWRDYTKLNEFLAWVKSTWREAATNATLPEPVVYRLNTTTTVADYPDDTSFTVEDEIVEGQTTGYKIFTFTKDTPAYRLTKFRAECADYVEMDSALYYYLFTELFLMIDSRAKNMFPSFNGGAVS